MNTLDNNIDLFEFELLCDEWYENIFSDDTNSHQVYLNSPILKDLKSIENANIYFKNNNNMTIQMIALKSNNIDLFTIFDKLNYDYLNDLSYTNSIGNNFFMMLTIDSRLYSNLFSNNIFSKWSRFIRNLQKKIINEYIDKINFKQVNIFGDSCWTLFAKNNNFILNNIDYLTIIKTYIVKNKISVHDLNLEHQDKDGNSIIHLTLFNHNFEYFFINFLETFDYLYLLGTPNNNNMTPLMLIIKNNLLRTFNYVFSYLEYLNIDQIDIYGNNCLFYLKNNHYYSKIHIKHFTDIYTKIKNFNIINNNNESLFIKLIKGIGLFDVVVSTLKNRNDFSVFNYIEKKNNISALMYFFSNLHQYNNYEFKNKELLYEIIDYEHNHILHKDNEGFNVFNFAIKLTDNELKIKILKRLNYDIELYKSMNEKYLNKYNRIYFYTYSTDGILAQLADSRDKNDLLIKEIFNNISNINYKYQDDKLKIKNNTYLTHALSSKNNKVFVNELIKICKDDYEYINHTSNNGFNFIESSISFGYKDYCNIIINNNIKIDKKYYQIKTSEKSLLMHSIYNEDIDMSHYIIYNSPLSNDEMKKYISHIATLEVKNSIFNKTSAFIEFITSNLLYDGNLSKTKNTEVFSKILNMGIFNLRENIIVFDKIINNKTKYLKNSKKSHENIKKGFKVICDKYQKDVLNIIKNNNDIINLSSDINNSIYSLVFKI